MATSIALNGKIRRESGKGAARRLRREESVPGVLYGKGQDPVMLQFDEREFIRALTGHSASNVIVDLTTDGEGGMVKTLIREIQKDPLSGEVIHVDLNQISLTEELEVEIPIELEGIPVGVKNAGGILQHSVRTLAVKCLPSNIPEMIRVDVTHLEIGDAIHVRDITLKNATVVGDPEMTLASVQQPAKAEEEAVIEEDAAVEGEPEVVGKKPEDEEGGGEEKKEG